MTASGASRRTSTSRARWPGSRTARSSASTCACRTTRWPAQQLGNEIFGALSLGLRLADGRVIVGPELYLSTVVKDGAFDKRPRRRGLIGLHTCIADVIRLGAGMGPGFSKGYGSPSVRRRSRPSGRPVQHEPPPEPEPEPMPAPKPKRPRQGRHHRSQGRRVPATSPASRATTRQERLPVRDRDQDNILDDDDACPDEPGVNEDDPAKNGCPIRDRDEDGILDEEDACPDLPGLASADAREERLPRHGQRQHRRSQGRLPRPAPARPTTIRTRTAARWRASRAVRSASSSR